MGWLLLPIFWKQPSTISMDISPLMKFAICWIPIITRNLTVLMILTEAKKLTRILPILPNFLMNRPFFSSGLAAILGRIFEGVFKFAGTFRDCNISKKEWVLRGESVLYVSFAEITRALQYDFDMEKEFCYKKS
ncbi:MAG: hypothetical protein J6V41_04735 [Kiritimatiellae bacterium]|nr:hypothetical protein [Kiritimatiellia bacterium]